MNLYNSIVTRGPHASGESADSALSFPKHIVMQHNAPPPKRKRQATRRIVIRGGRIYSQCTQVRRHPRVRNRPWGEEGPIHLIEVGRARQSASCKVSRAADISPMMHGIVQHGRSHGNFPWLETYKGVLYVLYTHCCRTASASLLVIRGGRRGGGVGTIQ